MDFKQQNEKFTVLLHNHLYHISVIKNKDVAFMGQLFGLWDIFTTQNYTLTFIQPHYDANVIPNTGLLNLEYLYA